MCALKTTEVSSSGTQTFDYDLRAVGAHGLIFESRAEDFTNLQFLAKLATGALSIVLLSANSTSTGVLNTSINIGFPFHGDLIRVSYLGGGTADQSHRVTLVDEIPHAWGSLLLGENNVNVGAGATSVFLGTGKYGSLFRRLRILGTMSKAGHMVLQLTERNQTAALVVNTVTAAGGGSYDSGWIPATETLKLDGVNDDVVNVNSMIHIVIGSLTDD